jgi:O-antigen biosynthesis protein
VIAKEASTIGQAHRDGDFQSWVELVTDELPSTGMLRAEGWAFFPTSDVQQIRAVVEGKQWTGPFGLPRPDVAATYPEMPHAAFSGFSIIIPQPRNPTFRLMVEAQDPSGKFRILFDKKVSLAPAPRKRTARRSPPPHHRYEGLQRGFVCWIDEPHNWRKLSRRFRVSGWCFAKNGEKIEAIRARVGSHDFPGHFGLFRPDVAALFGDREVTFKSGFDVAVEIPRATTRLRLEACDAGGFWREIFSQNVRAPLFGFRSLPTQGLWPIGNYSAWIKRYDTLRLADRCKIRAHIRGFTRQPRISILMPVYNPSTEHLRRAIESVRAQLYPEWELCIVDDASSEREVCAVLSKYNKRDSRIKVRLRGENGGIAATSNDALQLATGDFIALLDHDDELAPSALYLVAHEINQHPEARLIYSDEDKLDTVGRRTNAHFKSDWNGQLFLAQNFISHLSAFEAALIKELGFRPGFEGSQDYDFVLRCIEKIKPSEIRHIPHILYHWRMSPQSAALNYGAKPNARAAAIKAVQEHLHRQGIAADVVSAGDEDFRRVRYQFPNEKPKVSIIIPTRDMVEMLRPCVQSILEKTSYSPFEIVLIDNGTQEAAALEYLAQLARHPQIRILRDDEEFNYGRLNNLGVRETNAEFVALLNNDLTVSGPDWLGEMVSQAIQAQVGAVGARLLYPNGRIQHAGVILGGGGVAKHAHKGLPSDNHGYFSRAALAQELSAVTAACMLVRRSAYLEAGGFDEKNLRIAFNDVDFCLRLRQRGYRIVYTPYAEFYHNESASRGLEDTVKKHERFVAEIQYMKETWNQALLTDPYYNPNLSLGEELFTLAFPPRVGKPWQEAQ